MKFLLWLTFYFLSFVGIIAAIYMNREAVVTKTKDVPVLNYTPHHSLEDLADSSYTEAVDSLAVVIEGLLGDLTQYVTQMKERDMTISNQENEIIRLKRQRDELIQKSEMAEEEKIRFSKAQDKEKIKEISKTLGTLKPDILRPILANLPDNLIRIVYDKAKSQDKTKIFNSLPAARAGKILKKMAGNL